MELTKRQQQVFDWIVRFMAKHQRPPTIREIGIGLKISSPNGVMSHLKAIEKKKKIRRVDGKIQLVKPDRCPYCGAELRSG